MKSDIAALKNTMEINQLEDRVEKKKKTHSEQQVGKKLKGIREFKKALGKYEIKQNLQNTGSRMSRRGVRNRNPI